MKAQPLKITVIKKLSSKEVYGETLPEVSENVIPYCENLEVGQEFISDEGVFPEGMCSWAFADIQRDITHLRLGGDYPWIEEEGAIMSCCTDGARPVIFKLERIES